MFFKSFIAFLLIAVLSHGKTRLPPLPISTFSIIARDPKTSELGIAVQSKFIAVGGVVPYASAGVPPRHGEMFSTAPREWTFYQAERTPPRSLKY